MSPGSTPADGAAPSAMATVDLKETLDGSVDMMEPLDGSGSTMSGSTPTETEARAGTPQSAPKKDEDDDDDGDDVDDDTPETPAEAYDSLPSFAEDPEGRILALRALGEDRAFSMGHRARWLREAKRLRADLEKADPGAAAAVQRAIIQDPVTAGQKRRDRRRARARAKRAGMEAEGALAAAQGYGEQEEEEAWAREQGMRGGGRRLAGAGAGACASSEAPPQAEGASGRLAAQARRLGEAAALRAERAAAKAKAKATAGGHGAGPVADPEYKQPVPTEVDARRALARLRARPKGLQGPLADLEAGGADEETLVLAVLSGMMRQWQQRVDRGAVRVPAGQVVGGMAGGGARAGGGPGPGLSSSTGPSSMPQWKEDYLRRRARRIAEARRTGRGAPPANAGSEGVAADGSSSTAGGGAGQKRRKKKRGKRRK